MKASRTLFRIFCLTLSFAAVACGQSPATQEAKAVGLKQPLAFKGYELRIESFSQPAEIGFFKKKPAQGGSFVAVIYSLKNTTEKPLDFHARPQLKLVDPNGTPYESDYGLSGHHALFKGLTNKTAQELSPGVTLQDAAVWEVGAGKFDPKRWKIVIEGQEETPILLQ